MNDETTCGCGGALVFDPTIEGKTCGGNHLIGWNVCDKCRRITVSKRGAPGGGAWSVSPSGRSMVADGVKIRLEAGKWKGDHRRLLERIARLPDLESALREIARGAADPVAVARRALELATTAPDRPSDQTR